jgi:hypothetical protein
MVSDGQIAMKGWEFQRKGITHVPLKPPSWVDAEITLWQGTMGANGFRRKACENK